MARLDRERMLEELRVKVEGIVTDADRRAPDFDGKCSVKGWFFKAVLQVEREAARLACEVHDLRAMRIRGWDRRGEKDVPVSHGLLFLISKGEPYAAKTPEWRADVRDANREFFENLKIGMGVVKARIYFWGVGNWFGRRSFTKGRGPLAKAERKERKRRARQG